MKRLIPLLALLCGAVTVGAQGSFIFEAGAYADGADLTPFAPFAPGHTVRVGDAFVYRAHIPDTSKALTITFDSRAQWYSGAGWCRQGATALEQICDPGGPNTVEFWVRVVSRGNGAPIVATATYDGVKQITSIPFASFRVFLPRVVS